MLQLIAKIDKASRARLSWIQSFGASFGIVPKPIYGHIALGAFPEAEAEARISQYAEKLAGRKVIPVAYEEIAVMPQMASIAAKARQTEELTALYLGGEGEQWSPCTILVRDNMINLNWIKMAMDEMFQPFEAKAERIEIVRQIGNQFEVIAGFDLKD